MKVIIKMSNHDTYTITDLKDTEMLEKALYEDLDGKQVLKNRMIPLSDVVFINPIQISSIQIEE
ncbi:hypothetical protein EI975_07295 [Bacillus licheniformis]|uniref:hypothetical protein n=1 Tax=Bacillus licheniformis TaxID=1402 RepID=UPI0011EFFF21|nr:hypothetical protein [Bacillus licheniformis]KAA0815495.1 hypothetical protein EI974_16615 [Bacillus licheniformis]KAA0830946.1 hypothetical protein EI980_12320 [Bacillus licheniformis]KAA0847500.1 hypothetical protein EI975_07295 [Bacillus licheniformis]